MAYGNNNYNQGGNRQQYSGNQGGYQKSPYNAPPKREFNLVGEAEKYLEIYLTFKNIFTANEVPIEEVKDYLGGWVTSTKITGEKLGG